MYIINFNVSQIRFMLYERNHSNSMVVGRGYDDVLFITLLFPTVFAQGS